MLAGGQSLVPAMRVSPRASRRSRRYQCGADLNYLAAYGDVLAIGAIARDSDIERAPWIAERRWSLLHDVSRVVADPVVRQMGTVVGSLCHNDPSGDWTAVALAARAEIVVHGKSGPRRVAIDDFLVDSFTTAVGEGEMSLEVRFATTDERTAGSYQKVETQGRRLRHCGGRLQISLNTTVRSAKRAWRCRLQGHARYASKRPSVCSPARSPPGM